LRSIGEAGGDREAIEIVKKFHEGNDNRSHLHNDDGDPAALESVSDTDPLTDRETGLRYLGHPFPRWEAPGGRCAPVTWGWAERRGRGPVVRP
jgi:hypothetical protein